MRRFALLACAAAMLFPASASTQPLPDLPNVGGLPGGNVVEDTTAPVTNAVDNVIRSSPVGGGAPGGSTGSTGSSGSTSGGSAGGSTGSTGGGSPGPFVQAGPDGGGPSTSGSSSGGSSAAERRADRRRARARARRAAERRDAAAAARGDERGSRADRDGGSGGDEGGGVVPRPIRDVVEVIPGPVKLLLGVLVALVIALGLRSIFSAARARRLDRERKALLEDMGVLQSALLPDVPSRFGQLKTSVAYRPAEGLAAGGDFYDVFETEVGRVGIIVGDVCGHGREALAVTALMRYSLRAYLNAGLGPRNALQIAARALENDPDSMLTTVVLAEYDARAGTLTYACAGHEPPIVFFGPESRDPVIACSAPPIGAGMTTGLRQTVLPFGPGSCACFFTDGLVEAREGDRMIGRDELARMVGELDGRSAQALLDVLASRADGAQDDMAACLLIADDEAATPSGDRIEELELDESELNGHGLGERFLEACGVPGAESAGAIKAARATAAEFGSAVLRVTLAAKGGRVKVLPHDPATPPLVSNGRNGQRTMEVPSGLSA